MREIPVCNEFYAFLYDVNRAKCFLKEIIFETIVNRKKTLS